MANTQAAIAIAYMAAATVMTDLSEKAGRGIAFGSRML
jgi:hypothetical protein